MLFRSVPEDFTLPAEPAPALLASASASAEENGDAPPDAGEAPEVATSETRSKVPRSAAAFSDPTSTASRPRDKKRRRRSRSATWKKAVRIGLYIIIALAVIYFLIIANLRKG